jgi:hypothetical protein
MARETHRDTSLMARETHGHFFARETQGHFFDDKRNTGTLL